MLLTANGERALYKVFDARGAAATLKVRGGKHGIRDARQHRLHLSIGAHAAFVVAECTV